MTVEETSEAWKAFRDRVQLSLAYQVDIIVTWVPESAGGFAFPSPFYAEPKPARVKVSINVHTHERDTKEPITVASGRHVGEWTTDDAAIATLLDLLDIAIRHEIREAFRVDGKLVRDPHVVHPDTGRD